MAESPEVMAKILPFPQPFEGKLRLASIPADVKKARRQAAKRRFLASVLMNAVTTGSQP